MNVASFSSKVRISCPSHRLYCEKPPGSNSEKGVQRSSDSSPTPEKKDDHVQPIVPRASPTPNRITASDIVMRQLSLLAPADTKSGRRLWILFILIIVLLIWNADKIADRQRKNRFLKYDSLFNEQHFDQIIERATSFISDDKGEPQDYYYRALSYFMVSDYERALRDFQSVVECGRAPLAHVSSSLCYSCFAFCYIGRHAEALDVIEESIKINPYSSTAYKGQAEALLGQGRLEESLQALDRSIAIDPEDLECLNTKVRIYQKLHQYDRALEALDSILTKDSFNHKAHKKKLMILWEQKNFEKVVEEAEVIEMFFGHSFLIYSMKARLGRYRDALVNLESALFTREYTLPHESLEQLLALKSYCLNNLQ